MRAAVDLKATILPDGCLQLYSPRAKGWYRCDPIGTVMWLVLQRYDWDPQAAAEELATHWHTDVNEILADIDMWMHIFHIAGVVTGPVNRAN